MNPFNIDKDIGIGGSVKQVLLIVAVSLLLMVSPVSAQSQTAASGGDITPAGLLVAGTAIAVAVASVIGAIVLAIVNSQLARDKEERDRKADALKAEREEEQSRVQNLTELTSIVKTLVTSLDKQTSAALQDRDAANRDRAKLLDIVETKAGAQDGRVGAVKTIIEHNDERFNAVNEKLTSVVATLEELRDHAITAEVFTTRMDSNILKFDEALKILREMQDDSSTKLPLTPPASANGAGENSATIIVDTEEKGN